MLAKLGRYFLCGLLVLELLDELEDGSDSIRGLPTLEELVELLFREVCLEVGGNIEDFPPAIHNLEAGGRFGRCHAIFEWHRAAQPWASDLEIFRIFRLHATISS
jgi:hypothetical protein